MAKGITVSEGSLILLINQYSSSNTTPMKKIWHVPVMTPEKKIVHVPLMTPDRRPVELSELPFNVKGEQIFGARIKREDGEEEYLTSGVLTTPIKGTPIKQLPFSPSQVYNLFCYGVGCFGFNFF